MNINILEVGSPPKTILDQFGNTGQWMVNSLPEFVTPHIINFSGQSLSGGAKPDGWIFSGSFLSVTDSSYLMKKLICEIKELIKREVTILGVCFGHQLLAISMGGTVSLNPDGFEVGYKNITLTNRGKSQNIFKDLPNTFSVCQSHVDTVIDPPKGSHILAKNENGIQAIQYAHNIFGVQFHPELNPPMMNSISNIFAKTTNTTQEKQRKTPDLRDGRQVLLNYLNMIKKERNYAIATF